METNTRATFLKVAWLSICLGIGMEILLLIAAAGFGAFSAVKVIVVDLVQKISWSFIVCTGLALGVIFGGLVLFLTVHGAPKPPAAVSLLSKGINEVLFPVGCSLVLFSATALSRRKQ